MKKQIVFFAALLAVITVTLSSCRVGCIHGSGNAVTDTRKPGDFTKIDIEGSFSIILKQDSSHQVMVSADDNLQKYIHTIIAGGRLRIYSRKNLCNKTPMTITIGVGRLEFLRGSGAIEIKNEGTLNVGDLKLELAGASKGDLNINAANIVTDGSGSTELKLKGQATSHKLSFTGSGKLSAFDFVVSDYDLRTTGASDMEINVLKSLKINSTGASEIKYKGNPSSIQNDKTGAAEITHVN